MTGIFAQTSPGALGPPSEKRPTEDHVFDVPVLNTIEENPAQGCRLRAVYNNLRNMDRAEARNRLRLLQLLLTILALAFIRPQYRDVVQWITLFVLCHSFVISFVLFWDRRLCGTILRNQLPLLDWRRIELQYTCVVTLVLYGFFWGFALSDKGYYYYSANWCNIVSVVFTALTTLAYAAESWVQLRVAYDGRSASGH
ncbi:uncharacterized protein LOC128728812 [Anopheles nili]|uniref:uncharacterized protein LOC128728812 n=1 Tax=Anopheles nili TaxID=185578 RepID=UPI00237A5190|nr:uncharacterized protein LOC128728812 [Anopheles nili]